MSVADLNTEPRINPRVSDLEIAPWEFATSRPRDAYLPLMRQPVADVKPAPSGGFSKTAPEYMVLEPDTITSVIDSLRFSLDRGAGAAKLIPGVAGIGEALGRAGETLAPYVPEPVKGAGNLLTQAITDPFTAAGKRLQLSFGLSDEQRHQRFGKNIGEEGWNPLENITKAFQNMPEDVLDAVRIAGIALPFKGASLAGRGLSRIGAEAIPQATKSFATTLPSLARGQANLSATTAEKFGRMAGLGTLATSGAGIAADFALPKVAGNEPWAQEILNNRLVSEDHPWRFGFEVATSLPLDLFALGHMAARNRVSAHLAKAMLGEVRSPATLVMPNWRKGVDAGILERADVDLFVQHSLKQYAKKTLVDDFANTAGVKAAELHELPYIADEAVRLGVSEQEAANILIRQRIDELYERHGDNKLHRLAADNAREWHGWAQLDESSMMQQWSDYVRTQLPYEELLPHRVMSVDDVNVAMQASPALGYLRTAKDFTTKDRADFISRYPALSKMDGDKRVHWAEELSRDELVAKLEKAGEPGADLSALNATKLSAAIRENGGFTFNPRTGSQPKTGFAVSPYPELETVVPAGDGLEKAMQEFVDAHRDVLSRPGHNLGAWVVGDKVYLDVSIVSDTAAAATQVAKRFDQEAYFDLSGGKSVTVNPGAASRRGSPPLASDRPTVGESVRSGDTGSTPQVAPPARLGALMARLDDVNRRILAGETTLRAERGSILKEVSDIRERAANHHRKQAQLIEAKLAMRENEMAMLEGPDAAIGGKNAVDWEAIQQERKALEDAARAATTNFYKAKLAGTRWQLDYAPSGPRMRLVDDLGLKQPDKERTVLGRVFDKLFGALPNKQLSWEADVFLYEQAGRAGATPEKVARWKALLSEQVDLFTHDYKGGFRRSKYVSIFSLDPDILNRQATKAGLGAPPPGMSSWSEVIYRAYPGALKVFQKQVIGKAIDIPYSQRFHFLSRTLYPVLRFYYSPRFLLMNLGERSILGSAAGGARYWRDSDGRLEKLASLVKRDEIAGNTGFVDIDYLPSQVARLGYAIRGDEALRGVVRTLQKSPEMQDALRSAGVNPGRTDEVLKYLEDVVRKRMEVVEMKVPVTPEEVKLRKQIDGLREKLDEKGAGEDLLDRSELSRLEKELTKSIIERQVRDEAKALGISNQPLLNAISRVEHQLVDDARRVFMGNPERSAVERLLNSYLLYWPISYQLKTGRTMVEVMTSKGLGLPTGSAGAVAWARLHDDHKRKLEEDPEYREFFDKNRQTLFMLQALIPMSPESIGVTLSPITRLAGAAIGAGQDADVMERLRRATTVGPLYDAKLFFDVLAEQTKKGGWFSELIDSD